MSHTLLHADDVDNFSDTSGSMSLDDVPKEGSAPDAFKKKIALLGGAISIVLIGAVCIAKATSFAPALPATNPPPATIMKAQDEDLVQQTMIADEEDEEENDASVRAAPAALRKLDDDDALGGYRLIQTNMRCSQQDIFPNNTQYKTKKSTDLADCPAFAEENNCPFMVYKTSNSMCYGYTTCDGVQSTSGYDLYTSNAAPAAAEDSSWTGVTTKKGLGITPGTAPGGRCTDASLLGLEDSWYYDWQAMDSKQFSCYYSEQRFAKEFVPIILNCDSTSSIWDSSNNSLYWPYYEAWTALNVRFLLGYNEPDGTTAGQTCDPTTAAKNWVTVQKIANYFDPPLRLISPAPVSGCMNKSLKPTYPSEECGEGFAMGNSPWLNSFFSACDDIGADGGCNSSQIEFIALHDYEGAVEPVVTTDQRRDTLQTRINNIPGNYGGRLVWVTEINVGCGLTSVCRNSSIQDTATKEVYRNGNDGYPSNLGSALQYSDQAKAETAALDFLESSDNVFRYAWFSGRKEPNNFAGYADLITWNDTQVDSTLTELGENYEETRRLTEETWI